MKWRTVATKYADRAEVLRRQQPHLVLQIAENASLDEIKAAYRRLVKIYHPDTAHAFVQGSNTEVLKVINAAYETMVGRTGSKT